jgi:hypothetical protein
MKQLHGRDDHRRDARGDGHAITEMNFATNYQQLPVADNLVVMRPSCWFMSRPRLYWSAGVAYPGRPKQSCPKTARTYRRSPASHSLREASYSLATLKTSATASASPTRLSSRNALARLVTTTTVRPDRRRLASAVIRRRLRPHTSRRFRGLLKAPAVVRTAGCLQESMTPEPRNINWSQK